VAAGGAVTTASVCLPLATPPLITDFTTPPTDAGTVTAKATFGVYGTSFSGGTYIYPDSATGLVSDVSANNWHITGTVGDYSGLGFYWNNCALLDASAYKGISMTISGTIPAGTLFMSVGTAEDTITTAWYQTYGTPPISPTFGTCTPKSNSQYDGTCGAPYANITVTATPTTVTIPWALLTGGKPQPTVTPSKITGISFYFNWGGTGSVPYPVDVTIDDLSFMP
jgi:hypothetical protein